MAVCDLWFALRLLRGSDPGHLVHWCVPCSSQNILLNWILTNKLVGQVLLYPSYRNTTELTNVRVGIWSLVHVLLSPVPSNRASWWQTPILGTALRLRQWIQGFGPTTEKIAKNLNLLFCFLLSHKSVASGARDQQRREIYSGVRTPKNACLWVLQAPSFCPSLPPSFPFLCPIVWTWSLTVITVRWI